MKTTSIIANIHDLRTIPRTRRSAKPKLPTTAILELYMARNERDRLFKERLRLLKRKNQIRQRLIEIEEEMDGLLGAVHKKALELRGKIRGQIANDDKEPKQKKKMVIEY